MFCADCLAANINDAVRNTASPACERCAAPIMTMPILLLDLRNIVKTLATRAGANPPLGSQDDHVRFARERNNISLAFSGGTHGGIGNNDLVVKHDGETLRQDNSAM
jgi:hypothetical protein